MNKKLKLALSILIIGVIAGFVFNFNRLGINKRISDKCKKEEFKAILIEKQKTNRAYVLKLKKRDGSLFEPRCGVSEELFYKITLGDSLIKTRDVNECFIKTKDDKTIKLLYIDE